MNEIKYTIIRNENKKKNDQIKENDGKTQREET